jgi:predicted nucleic acid-binding protein
VKKREAQDKLIISAITEAELFAGRTMRDAEAVERVELLLSVFEIAPVNSTVAREAGRLRREYGCSLPDALIAATAILWGAELITRNERHFKMIPAPFKFTVPY